MKFGTKLSEFPVHIDRGWVNKRQEEARRRAQEKLESDAAFQRRKMMTNEQRGREAIDHLAKDMKRLSEENGKEMTWDQAKRYMTKIAQDAERKDK